MSLAVCLWDDDGECRYERGVALATWTSVLIEACSFGDVSLSIAGISGQRDPLKIFCDLTGNDDISYSVK